MLVEQNHTQMVQPVAKYTPRTPTMRLDRQGLLVFMQPLTHQGSPNKGQRQNREQTFNPFRPGQMSRFKIETSRFQSTKQRFNLPPLPVEGQGLRGATIGDEYQQVHRPL